MTHHHVRLLLGFQCLNIGQVRKSQSPGSEDGAVRKVEEKNQLEESSPLLIHNGVELFGTSPLAEYMDQCWKDQESLVPSNLVEKCNMNKCLRSTIHSKIEQIWNGTLMFWLEWHCGENSEVKMANKAYTQ